MRRSLAISDFLNRKWVPEVQHFRPRPLPQSKIGDSLRRFPFLSLFPRRDAILDRLVEASLSPSSRIWMLVSVELSDWWRRKRDSAIRIYVFTLFIKMEILWDLCAKYSFKRGDGNSWFSSGATFAQIVKKFSLNLSWILLKEDRKIWKKIILKQIFLW